MASDDFSIKTSHNMRYFQVCLAIRNIISIFAADFATCLLTHQMFDGCNWMVDNHSWPRPSHHHPDTLFHFWSIAMHRTFLAGGLLLAKTASVKSAMGIVQQFLATWA